MTWLIKILRFNDILAPTLSLIANLLLLYLIITIKKLELKRVSFVLIPNCFIDIILSLMNFAVSPQVFNVEYAVYIITESLISFYGFKGANVMLWIYATIVLASMNAICIPFYLRYLVICRLVFFGDLVVALGLLINITITMKHVILPYIILLLCCILIFLSLIWCFPIIPEMSKEFKAPTLTKFWLDEYPNGPIFVAADIDTISFIVPYSFIIFTCIISYSMVLFCSLKITKCLQSHVTNYSGSKILSKQLHKTLITQAIGPFLVANIPIFSLIAMIFLKIENITISLCFSFFVGWIPIVNPLAAIFIITPFKTKLKGIFKNFKNKVNSSFSTP